MADGERDEKLRSEITGAAIIAVIMILCILGGLFLSPTYKDLGYSAFGEEEATNPMWAVFYIGLVVVMAVVIILLIKWGLQKFIHFAFLGAVFFTIVFVLTPLVSMAVVPDPEWERGDAASDLAWVAPSGNATLDHITWNGVDGYAVVQNDRLELYDGDSNLKAAYFGHFGAFVLADVRGDNRSEIVVGDGKSVKVFDQKLDIRLDLDLDGNVTWLSASRVLGLDRESLVVGWSEGAALLIPSGSGFTLIDLEEEAGGLPGEVLEVYLRNVDDTTVKVYVLTTEGLFVAELDTSIVPLVISGAIACVPALAAVILLLVFPEWYVVDATGVILAIGAMTLIGISLSILPLFILLVALAVYDAIAVYKTKHMITMASSVIEMRLPVLLVIPKTLKYSFRDQDKLKKQLEKKEERGALFIGLGDIIIPGTLVVSAFTFLGSGTTYFGVGANVLVALFTLLGIMVGYTVLMRFVLKGNPQAGLPMLNSGAIFGYVIGYLVLYRDLTLGFEVPTWGFGF